MRRFLIRNAVGEQVGEGVQFADGEIAIHDPSHRRSFYPCHFGPGLTEDGQDLGPLEHMLHRANEWAGRGAAVSIEWLDPEPADRSREPPGGGGYPVASVTYLTREQAERLPRADQAMTPDEFRARFGRAPEKDDRHRVTCEQAGEVGHWFCGICGTHNVPRFECGCRAQRPAVTRAALLKLAELEPELMREFGGGRPLLVERGRKPGSPSARSLEDVEAWLRSRGVIATVEMQGRVLVPVAARLVDEQ